MIPRVLSTTLKTKHSRKTTTTNDLQSRSTYRCKRRSNCDYCCRIALGAEKIRWHYPFRSLHKSIKPIIYCITQLSATAVGRIMICSYLLYHRNCFVFNIIIYYYTKLQLKNANIKNIFFFLKIN